MPRYVKRSNFIRKRRRNIAWYKKKYSVAALASKAVRGVRYLRGLVNSEMYKLDTVWVGHTISGGVAALTAIAQGDGDNQRTGNSIYVRSYNFKGAITRGSADCQVRVSVVMDTQQISDTTPGLGDIYEGSTPYSHLNSNTVGRFKVLFSRVYTLTSDNPIANVNINLPMRHHVRYNGTASSDVQRGGLFWANTTSAGAGTEPTISGEHRLSYHDN